MTSAALCIGVMLSLPQTSFSKPGATSTEQFTVDNPQELGTTAPVVLIGADGMTFDVLDPLIKAGKLPNIARMQREGVRGVLTSENPMRSPAIWTTLATGQPRAVHKIYDFITGSSYWPKEIRSAEQKLVTSDMRAAPAIWQVASAAKKKSLVVGWLNTWPAERIDGVMFAPYVALNELRQTSIKGRIYKDASSQAYPSAIFAEMLPLILPADSISNRRLKPLADIPPKGSALYEKIPILERYMYSMRWSVASTLTNVRLLEAATYTRGPFDLYMTYFDGSDTLAHRFWLMRQTEADIRTRLSAHGFDPALAPELKKRFGYVIDGYYRLIDDMIGRIRRAVGKRATMILVSDHGWGASTGSKALHESVPFDGVHLMQGVFIAAGPQIRHARIEPLSLYEIAPTVLYLMGLSPPTSMPGRIATEIVKKSRLAHQKPVTSTAALPNAPAVHGQRHDAPHSEEEMERLRSLGYID